MIVGARLQCPMVIGLGEGETFLASDVVAFLEHTREAKLVGDRELVVITPEGAQLLDLDGEHIERAAETVTWDSAAAEKGGYETFMLKEIHEQPDALRETIGERLEGGEVVLDLGLTDEQLLGVDRVSISACGTACHAGMVGRLLIEEWARMPVDIEYASEFRYRFPVLDETHARDRGLAVGRDGRHDRRAARRARGRRAHARDQQPDGLAAHARGRRHALHAQRPRDLRGGDQDVHVADHGLHAARAAPRRAARHARSRAHRRAARGHRRAARARRAPARR